jgi:3-deoxy-D-manno-octulosonate 8-phosphate phosphatase (KDO 8-P phosphatase)
VSNTPTLAERCAAIELLVVDVDGVLTDGRIIYTAEGVELKAFHVRDGSALVFWQKLGKQVAILSGRKSKAVDVRAQELGIRLVRQGAADKLPAFRQLLVQLGLRVEQTAAVGDDLPDLPVLRAAGLAIAVADACPEVRAVAHHITVSEGGRGAVREVIELILKHQGRWDGVVSGWSGG